MSCVMSSQAHVSNTNKKWEVTGSDWLDWTNLVVQKLDGSQLIQLPFKNYTDLTWSK